MVAYGLFPVLVFLSLTVAALHLILYQTDLQLKLSAMCDPDLTSYPRQLAYTNNPNANKLLCAMVVFFHTLMGSAHRPLLAVAFPLVGIAALIPLLEAARNRCSLALRMPTVVSALFQVASMGFIMPIYSLLFVSTGTVSMKPSATLILNPPSQINQANAEALLFGIVLGYVLPTTAMLFLARPSITAVWQGFPFIIALAIFAHKVIRPPSRYSQSGHATVVVTLAFAFVLSALIHAIYVWPVLTDIIMLQTNFVPIVGVPDPITASLADAVLEFLKWDVIFGGGSVALATFWVADSVPSLVGLLAWYSIATVVLGPAAAIAGVFLWRERRLNGQSQSEKSPQKTE